VDFNSAADPRGRFSHWTSFKNPRGKNVLTHFEGISSPSPGEYVLAADSIQLGPKHIAEGSWVVVRRNPNGSFGKSEWVDLHYPDVTGWTSNDSVAGNHSVGIAIGITGAITYQATVSM
jgi:trimeric autotransporter adhesin